MSVQIIRGDARSTGLAERSVHMIATSPPYWGLRSYLKKDDPAKASEIGAETTPEAYVESMRDVGRECYRVLRDDGIMWLNLGDTYASGDGLKVSRPQQSRNGRGVCGPRELHPSASRANVDAYREYGLPSGNIVGIPWRVAFALQADGWILRAAIPWVKANCMPESVTNRPTVAHEYVFLLAKAKGYFFDADAVRVGLIEPVPRNSWEERKAAGESMRRGENPVPSKSTPGGVGSNPSGRNIRTSDFMNAALDEYDAHVRRVRAAGGLLLSPDGDPLTFLVNPVPNSLGHFAMWPPKLVAPMILAGTSARGCCSTCGAQWRRRVERLGYGNAKGQNRHDMQSNAAGSKNRLYMNLGGGSARREVGDLGFFPSCSCPTHEPIPSTVFDPFGGTGTTAQVACALGRRAVLCELNEAYHPLIAKRLEERLNPEDWRPIKRDVPKPKPSKPGMQAVLFGAAS